LPAVLADRDDGTFYDMLGPLKAFVPEFLSYKRVIGLLTTPIVFGPGRQFFTNSWRGLKHGVTDMNLLYATGIGAAYGIALINTLFPKAGFGGEAPRSSRAPRCSPLLSSWDAGWRR
jgi:cation transport ATPase